MTLDDFRQSLTAAKPPAEFTLALAGLWWDAKGDWKRAHESAQEDEGTEDSWVHAYLHRKEWRRVVRSKIVLDTAKEFLHLALDHCLKYLQLQSFDNSSRNATLARGSPSQPMRANQLSAFSAKVDSART